MKTAVILLGHGSRIAEANNAIKEIAGLVKEKGNYDLVDIAFLQFSKPLLGDKIDECMQFGIKKIIIQPYFLHQGRHIVDDIPEEIEKARQKHPHLEIIFTRPLGVHSKLADVVIERITERLNGTTRD